MKWLRFRKTKGADQAERTDAEQLPRPEDLKEEGERRAREKEQRSRADFFAELPAFKSTVIARIKQDYDKPGDLVLVYFPRAMWKRTDLIDSEIVAWANQRGWEATHRWGAFSREYGLYLRKKGH